MPLQVVRPPRQQKRSRKTLFVALAFGAAALGAVAVWQATSELPFLTHREAISTALALEEASSIERVRALVRSAVVPPPVPLPGVPQPVASVAEWIWSCKSVQHYTFLGVADERTDAVRLRFRVHAEAEGEGGAKTLVDYHDFRIARVDGAVVVTDVRSLLCGGWFTDLARERERLAPEMAAPSGQAFTAAMTQSQAGAMLAAFRALPEPARRSIANGTTLLAALVTRELGPERDSVVRDAVDDLRTLHPEKRAMDLWLLYHVQTHGYGDRLREDAMRAVERLSPAVDDAAWMRSAMKQLRD